MNLSDIIVSVQRQFGDESEAQITKADIIRWANDAQIDINRKTEALQVHSETDVLADDGSYTLPADHVRLRRVTYNDIVLKRTDLETLDKLSNTRDSSPSGHPAYYYVWGQKLFIFPRPSKAGQGNLDIYYVKMPDPLVNEQDSSELPIHMHQDIVRYCLARAKELDQEDDKAREILIEYEQRISLSRDEIQNPEIDSYPSITTRPEDFGYGDYPSGGWH